MSKKLTIEEIQRLAQKRNGKCLSKKYTNMRTEMKWQCEKGHIWKTTAGNIKYNNAWCPSCAGNSSKTIQDMQKLAQERGGKCLSNKYINDNTKLEWQCEHGHKWSAVPGSIKQGSWCPYCAGQRFNIEDLKKYADKHNGKCLSKKYINSKTKYEWYCNIHDKIFLKTWGDVKNKNTWCPLCVKERTSKKLKKYNIQDMQGLAKKKKGKCLSDKYINNTTHLLWQCEKEHVWKATPKNVKKGH